MFDCRQLFRQAARPGAFLVYAVALVAALACGGDDRAEALELWAAEMCEFAESLEADLGGRLIEARESIPPGSGRDGVAQYASAIREVEVLGEAALLEASLLELPPSDTLPFHRAQIRGVELLIENLDLFAADMESFLVTDDVEALGEAYPAFLQRDEDRVAALSDAFNSIPQDAGVALDAVPDCGRLRAE